MTTLFALRIFGPIDAFEIQSKTKAPINDIADDIWDLQKDGHACNPTGYLWDVTEEGRLLCDARLAVARDGERECVGVKAS